MVPNTWISLVLFLFVVSPGILFDLLESRRRASAAESAFHEIGRVVLGSVGFTGLAVAMLAVVRVIWPFLMPDPAELIVGGSRYFAQQYLLILIAIVVETVLAHAAAWGFHVILAKVNGGDTIKQASAWSSVFKSKVPKRHAVYARIRLGSGAIYSGQVANFTADLPLVDREIILTRPLASKTGSNPLVSLPEVYQYLVIRGAAVDSIAVEYRPPDIAIEAGQTPAPASPDNHAATESAATSQGQSQAPDTSTAGPQPDSSGQAAIG